MQASCSTPSGRRTSCARMPSSARRRIRPMSPNNASATTSRPAASAPASMPASIAATSPRPRRRCWCARCYRPASTPPSTALAPRSIAWRDFPTNWRGCAAIRRWRATRSRRRCGSKARCRPSSGPRRATSRSAGIAIGEGEKVLMFLGSANRDPRRWENADSYDITRRTCGHVGYGSGIHMCVGQLVARLKAR